MDDIDRAQQLEQNHRDNAINAARSADESQQNKVGDRVYCFDCEIEIPDERLEAKPNASRCINCQEFYEKGIT